MITNDLFKIKYKPYYFYSFVENKWIINNNSLQENDIVTRIDELTDELAMAMATSAATETSMEMAYDKFWNEFGKSNKEKRIELIKENFHIYFVDNQRTIIWKEFLRAYF